MVKQTLTLMVMMTLSFSVISEINWEDKRQKDNSGGKATPGEMEPGTVLMGALDLRGHSQAEGFAQRLITMASVYGITSDRHRENAIEELYRDLHLRELDGAIGYYAHLKLLSHENDFYARDDVGELATVARELAESARSSELRADAEQIARRADQCVEWIDKGRDSLDSATEQSVLIRSSMVKPDAEFKFRADRFTVCQNALIYMPRVMSPLIPKGY